jgi:CheY-like chemotaxis protein
MSSCRGIVVVDDDEAIRETTKLALELRGYVVLTAANGKEAFDLLGKIPPPCLILLDLMMPVMDGWGFVKALELDPKLEALPVVVVTAFGSCAERINARRVASTIRARCSTSRSSGTQTEMSPTWMAISSPAVPAPGRSTATNAGFAAGRPSCLLQYRRRSRERPVRLAKASSVSTLRANSTSAARPSASVHRVRPRESAMPGGYRDPNQRRRPHRASSVREG